MPGAGLQTAFGSNDGLHIMCTKFYHSGCAPSFTPMCGIVRRFKSEDVIGGRHRNDVTHMRTKFHLHAWYRQRV